jgi:AbrB family looped-hinge helix DNA binding protein
MRTTVSSKGQVVIPAELRVLDEVKAGQQFTVERLGEGEYVLRRVEAQVQGLVDWLRACPEKDWFEPLVSESTDTL